MGRQRERERKRETGTEPQRPSASREHAEGVVGGEGVETGERDREGGTAGGDRRLLKKRARLGRERWRERRGVGRDAWQRDEGV